MSIAIYSTLPNSVALRVYANKKLDSKSQIQSLCTQEIVIHGTNHYFKLKGVHSTVAKTLVEKDQWEKYLASEDGKANPFIAQGQIWADKDALGEDLVASRGETKESTIFNKFTDKTIDEKAKKEISQMKKMV